MDGWHNTRSKVSLFIGKLPNRKQYALYTEGPEGLEILAYFKTEQKAIKAWTWIENSVYVVQA